MNYKDWCPTCGGTGTDPNDPRGRTCPTCHGDAIVDIDE